MREARPINGKGGARMLGGGLVMVGVLRLFSAINSQLCRSPFFVWSRWDRDSFTC